MKNENGVSFIENEALNLALKIAQTLKKNNVETSVIKEAMQNVTETYKQYSFIKINLTKS